MRPKPNLVAFINKNLVNKVAQQPISFRNRVVFLPVKAAGTAQGSYPKTVRVILVELIYLRLHKPVLNIIMREGVFLRMGPPCAKQNAARYAQKCEVAVKCVMKKPIQM